MPPVAVNARQEALEKRSLAQRAYDALEHRIVTLDLAPGSWLREQDIAARLGFGRTPVREALQRLASHGVVIVRPRKGVQVTTLRHEELAAVLETRRVLERLQVVKASERADDGQRRRLHGLADGLRRMEDDAESYYRQDRELDRAVAAAAANPYLARSLEPLRVHCRRLWFAQHAAAETGQLAGAHAALAVSIADGHAAEAVRIANGILAHAEESLKSLIT